MDESNIKIAIKNMNVWLDECHNDSDTVVMTANVLRSIRDNYCELLRCRDAIERLADRNRKCIYLSDEETSEYCADSICPQFKTEGQIKSEAIKEFAEKVETDLDKRVSKSIRNRNPHWYIAKRIVRETAIEMTEQSVNYESTKTDEQ